MTAARRRWPEPSPEPPANSGTLWRHPASFPTEAAALQWGSLCSKWEIRGVWQDRLEGWHLLLRSQRSVDA